jgi:hypothetical protein
MFRMLSVRGRQDLFVWPVKMQMQMQRTTPKKIASDGGRVSRSPILVSLRHCAILIDFFNCYHSREFAQARSELDAAIGAED